MTYDVKFTVTEEFAKELRKMLWCTEITGNLVPEIDPIQRIALLVELLIREPDHMYGRTPLLLTKEAEDGQT